MATRMLATDIIYKHVPPGSRITINDTVYEWSVLDRASGEYQWTVNGTEWVAGYFDQLPEPLKHHLIEHSLKKEAAQRLEKRLGHSIDKECTDEYLKAWTLLCQGGNAFLKFCAGVVSDYHALDYELKQLLLRSAMRASYSSNSALLHVDCSGASGAGKSDIINKVLALIPARYKKVFTSTSATAVYYNTLQRTQDAKGNTATPTSDPNYYRNMVIAITEVADSGGFTALKALAEIDERAEQTHSATVNGVALNMSIRGPRCVCTTSVEGVDDTQVKRRFIHVSVSEDTEEHKLEKIELITNNLLERVEIEDDPRTKVAQAGFDLLFRGDITFEQTDSEAARLIKLLGFEFSRAGYSITSIRQFQTLCECAAVEKRFNRERCRIEVEDVCDAWFLLTSFERETLSKLSQNGVKILEAIKTLSDEYDRQFAYDYDATWARSENVRAKRPIRKDIALQSGVSPATVYRHLDTKNADHMGILVEPGYVTYEYDESRRANAFELTELGEQVLSPTVDEVEIDGTIYRPISPTDVPDEPANEDALLTILTDSHEDENEKE